MFLLVGQKLSRLWHSVLLWNYIDFTRTKTFGKELKLAKGAKVHACLVSSKKSTGVSHMFVTFDLLCFVCVAAG